MRPKTRLQLTWQGKERRLLTHGIDTYEWVDPSDWRVSEVRLLEHQETIGDALAGNLVIHGDALHALTSLTQLPEFKEQYLGKVKLVYIDPPFNTGQAFKDYNDAVEHSIWLTMMRDRLVQIHQLLASDGTVWVHLDDVEAHRMRCVLDEIFGAENFIATVIWQKSDSPRNSARFLSVDQDYIHVYAKSAQSWRPNKLPRTDKVNAAYENPDNDPKGPWRKGDLRANKPYSLGLYTVTGPTGKKFSPPPGKYWRISEDKFKQFDSDGRIWWGPTGDALPLYKRYLDEVSGLVPRTLWTYQEAGSNRTSSSEMKRLTPGAKAFDTPKPEKLLERILTIASQPGDIVLDCFAGSGTTAAVALKMNRRFVTVEVQESNLESYVLPRLTMVVDGEDEGGISAPSKVPLCELPEGVTLEDIKAAKKTLEALIEAGTLEADEDAMEAPMHALTAASRARSVRSEWEGGSGFQLLSVAPSIFEADDDGDLYLAAAATPEALARSVAAQVRYEYEPHGPFMGRRGRSRLAVLDAMATEGAIRLLVDALGEKETLLVVAQGIAPGIPELLTMLRKGSKTRKIPGDLARRRVLRGMKVTLGEVAL